MRKIVEQISKKIYRLLRDNGLLKEDKVRDNIRKADMLFGKDLEATLKDYYIKEISRTILIIVVTLVIAISFILFKSLQAKKDIVLLRPDYGDDKEEVILYADTDKEELKIEVLPVVYTQKALQDITSKLDEEIKTALLGENEALDKVEKSLNLAEDTAYPGIYINWKCGNYEIMDRDGTIHNENIREDVSTYVTAEVFYEDKLCEYTYDITIIPSKEGKTARYKLQQAIYKLLEKEPYKKEINIASSIDGIQLYTPDKWEKGWLYIGVLGIVVSILLWAKDLEEIKSKNKVRDIQLLKEYPNFVNKLVLLLGAGLSMKKIVYKLAEEYEYRRKKEENYYNYLYEELVITLHEMKTGAGEVTAYYNMGRRIGIPAYLKLVTMIVQNIKRGSVGLLAKLEEEEIVAFNNRKELAKKLGEEVGTKLLIPMVLQMAIVMVIIMIPAMLSL